VPLVVFAKHSVVLKLQPETVRLTSPTLKKMLRVSSVVPPEEVVRLTRFKAPSTSRNHDLPTLPLTTLITTRPSRRVRVTLLLSVKVN
jgi:hypothetical protein